MEDLSNQARQLFGIHLSERQMVAFATFERELLEWNSKFNLTAIRDAEGIRSKHFLDSLACSLAWKDAPPAKLIDIGTGAGFPGIPLKIIYPSMHLTLVESVGKKANFCRHLIDVLNLNSTEVLTTRAEEVGQMIGYREAYDWAVARAVADLPVLAEYLLPLVRIGGGMLAQKGRNAPAEVQNARHAFQVLGGSLRQLLPVTIPHVSEERYLVIVDKLAASPDQYPRNPGTPAKKPLS